MGRFLLNEGSKIENGIAFIEHMKTMHLFPIPVENTYCFVICRLSQWPEFYSLSRRLGPSPIIVGQACYLVRLQF